jgi:hypothetical protein
VLQATNADYANRLYQSPLAKESKRFSKPKLSQTAFTIDHYAGGVRGLHVVACHSCISNASRVPQLYMQHP